MRPARVSPLSGRALSQQSVANGGTVGSGTQANVDTSGGAVTILAPTTLYPSEDQAAFIVWDSGGVADASPITIDGNGRLIDGEASYEMSTAGGTVAFLYNQDSGEWNRCLVPRTDQNAAEPFYLAKDFAPATTAAAVSRIQDPVLIATSANQQWSGAVNGTAGLRWVNHRDLTIVGVDAFIKMGAATRNLKVSVWRPNGTVLVTKTFNNVAQNAGRVRFMFDVPQAISAALVLIAGNGWSVGLYETSGNEICGWNTILSLASPEIATMRAHVLRKDVYAYGNFFQNGDAFPSIQQTANILYGVCPTFEDEETPDGITVIT